MLEESKLFRINVILTTHPIKRKSTILKEPTDKFKLEHLQDALLKNLANQYTSTSPKKVEGIVLSTNGTYYAHSLIRSSC
jgi:hypothetical protein